MTLQYLDKQLKKIFRLENFDTISNIKNKESINFKLESESKEDLENLYNEASNLIIKLFDKNYMYLRLTFWDKNEYIAEKYSSNIQDIVYKRDSIILLLEFKNFNALFSSILKEHLNYELAIDPSINVTCFIFNIEIRTILNIYDDRGADYIVLN